MGPSNLLQREYQDTPLCRSRPNLRHRYWFRLSALFIHLFLTIIGRWALEVADQYPQVNVVGLDLAPIQPTYIPLNCEFQVADLTQDLVDLNTGFADLIHSR